MQLLPRYLNYFCNKQNMADINKYLESQLALARQKNESKSNKVDVSQRSKAAADEISKKQLQGLPSKKWSQTSKQTEIAHQVITDVQRFPLCSTSHARQNLKKIVDDGDKKLYEKRVKKWRKNLAAVFSNNIEERNITADIQYVLNGNKNPEENHKLQNGLCVPKYIWKQLYKFQKAGVKWLCHLHEANLGGMLGDEMGLGKTIQIIAFLAGLHTIKSGSWGGLGPSIIVAPATVIYQWVSHFHYWFPSLRVAVLHHTGSHTGEHNKLIKDMHGSRGILLITYAGVVKYSKDLISRKWHYLILDEGHKIKNPDSQASKIVKKFNTPHRLLITGSPMQNSLQELWSLFDFMRPGLLGTYTIFMEHFALPITQGGYANATAFQQAAALEIATALKNIISPCMMRRTKAEVQDHIKLPKKNEQVLFCTLSQEQRDLYQGYVNSDTVRNILNKNNKYGDPIRSRVLVALSTLRKICNHPDLYLNEAQKDCNSYSNFGNWERSGKMIVVNSLLRMWQQQGHRALIFSQSREMLRILEQYLQNQEMKYLKMDGTVNVSHRQNMIKTFNENFEYFVFLSTTRVGGLGVNLTGANRVIIYDPDWNPATDDQAKERAWRIGQEKNVTVYRLLSAGTIEEKTYQRQIFKQFLNNKILIDPNRKNVLTTSMLQGLFMFETVKNYDGDTETASLFKHTKINISIPNKNNDNNVPHASSISSNHKLMAITNVNREICKIKPNALKETADDEVELLKDEIKYKKILEIPSVDKKIKAISTQNILPDLEIINMLPKNIMKEKGINNVSKNTDNYEDHCGIFLSESTTTVIKGNTMHNSETTERKRSSGSLHDSVTWKKAKKKKHNNTEKEVKSNDEDDYVLCKLFAKSAVKDALHHDIVVGFVEKEKQHRLKEEAVKKAGDAVRALESSSNKFINK